MPRHTVGAHPGKAFALVLIMGLSALAVLAPPAAAQESPFLCFEGETTQGNAVPLGNCSFGTYAPANFMQGDTVRIKASNVEGSTPYVRVRCIENCPGIETSSYYARWRESGLRFPWDFNNDRGPFGDGNLTLVDKVPRFNSSWEATLLLSNNEAANPKRTFHVWLLSLYRSENMTVHPGEHHLVRSAFLDPGAPAEVHIERRYATGKYETVLRRNLSVPSDGILRVDWDLPKDESTRIAGCGDRPQDCYRLRVTSVGKPAEFMAFGIAPATLRVMPVLEREPDWSVRQRTSSIEQVYTLNYPGGAYQQGPKLAMGDIRQSAANPEGGLRVIIERVNRTNPDEAPEYYNDTRLVYVPDRFAWIVNWTVPRDLPLNEIGATNYRLRLAPAQDIHGNRIIGETLANLTIERATLVPVLVDAARTVERADHAEFSFRVLYHNGSVLGAAENKTGLRGCVVRNTAPLRTNCPEEDIRTARFENGTWVIGKHFPRDYPHVDAEGGHRVFLLDGFQDPWGNRVDGLPNDNTRAYVSEPFTVVPGSPRIAFSTVQRGEDVATLVRGHRVNVQATIAFADGSAFNSTALPNNARTLNVTLTRRGENGAVQSEAPLVLTLTDARAGRWMGALEMPRDDTASPTGRWTFAFDLADNLTVPNTNVSAFDRNVAAALIQLAPTFQPPANVPIGSTVKFRFKLAFDDGRTVPATSVAGGLSAHVYRYDRAAKAAVGEPVSGLLEPLRIAGSEDEFTLEWQVPNRLFAGDYVYVVTGGDMHGNRLQDATMSRSFATFADTRVRSVLVEPPASVKRGDSATVVFDGIEGDVGGPGAGVPAVRVERWDAGTAQWVIERQTTRISDDSTPDHIGVFPVTTNTIIGIYRFRLEGRDPSLHQIHSVSANFTVEPTVVQRAIIEAPPERVVKGELVQFSYERRNGDRVLGSEILFDGRSANLQQPSISNWGGHINVSFIVPYEARTGNYSVRVGGRDLYGNSIDIVSPNVEVLPASLLGKVIGNPSRVVDRGETARILFGITNPDGGLYFSDEVPLVEVHDGQGPVASVQAKREGLTFVAEWTPGPRVEESEYSFVVSGAGAGGNTFPTLRSNTFRVAPGLLVREAAAEPPIENVRMNTITLSVPFDPQDEFAAFKLGYFGLSYDAAPALFETRDPTTTTALPHTIDIEAGRYVARFVTDHTTPLGAYRIYMEGRDGHGNDLAAKSRVFLLKPTTILLSPDGAPPDETFGEGKVYERTFVARYRDGTPMTEEHGTPSVALLYDDYLGAGRQPVKPAPEVAFRGDRWVITWTGPDIMPDGAYTLTIGGTDSAGNGVAGTTLNEIRLTRPTSDSVGVFLKDVPGAPPAFVLLAVIALALVLARRRA